MELDRDLQSIQQVRDLVRQARKAQLVLANMSQAELDRITAALSAAAAENARLNGVEENFTGICGNLAEQVTGRYQVVAANIVADVVIELSRSVAEFMVPGGVFLISGIIDAREDDVLAALAGRFTVIDRQEERGWVAMALKLA